MTKNAGIASARSLIEALGFALAGERSIVIPTCVFCMYALGKVCFESRWSYSLCTPPGILCVIPVALTSAFVLDLQLKFPRFQSTKNNASMTLLFFVVSGCPVCL